MAYRKPGTLLPLERRVLEVAVSQAPEGTYGFALAQELAADVAGERKRLIGHGTLYKVLDRLRRAELLTAHWESAEDAAAEDRPRRRIYSVTAKGAQALAAAPGSLDRGAQVGEAPA